MKILEQIALTIFSLLILIICLALCLVLFGWLEASNIYIIIQYLKSAQSITNTTLIVSVVLMLLSVKCIFFPSYTKEREQKSEGILLENETGKLLISIETIESLVKGVVSGFANIKAVNCKVKLDKSVNNVIINLTLVVAAETIIKELSANLQDRIKEVIKKTTEIEVKEVTIKIKNIEEQKSE